MRLARQTEEAVAAANAAAIDMAIDETVMAVFAAPNIGETAAAAALPATAAAATAAGSAPGPIAAEDAAGNIAVDDPTVPPLATVWDGVCVAPAASGPDVPGAPATPTLGPPDQPPLEDDPAVPEATGHAASATPAAPLYGR